MLEFKKIVTLKEIACVATVFCYVFSFYIIGPITSSVIIAVPFLYLYLHDKAYFHQDVYSVRTLSFLTLIIFAGLAYSALHVTFDYSYVKTMFGQMIHLSMGIVIVTELRRRYHITAFDIEKYIVYAFFVQSIIEIVASVTPPFASALLPFNRAYELQTNEAGRRGLALAAGTGWSLGLAFGLLYIIYVKRYLLDGINVYKIITGVVLLAGTMFAGRTGFVGALFGVILFFLNANRGGIYKILIIIKILLFIVVTCLLFYILFPAISIHLVENVFPFAFEPFYKLFYNDEFSTGSTDRLQEMWEVTITPIEVLIGTGYFTDPLTGSYYKHIDIGVMRNLFYWGIVGYMVLILYQLFLLSPIKVISEDKKYKWNVTIYRLCLTTYLFLMELKAMTIGFNKMAVSIVFLLGYFYYCEYQEQKHESFFSRRR